MQRYFPATVLIVIASLAIPRTAHSQVDSGVILGTVFDQSGGVLPGAKVALRNESTDFAITTTTDSRGDYKFSPVRIGTYVITVDPAGKDLAQASRVHVRVDIQQQVLANFTLQPVTVSQTIEVTALPEVLQTQDASIGQVVGQRTIQDLPLNGRNYTFLAQLLPGVTVAQWDYHLADNTGRFSANGTSAMENNYLLDGMDNNSLINTRQSGHDYVVLSPVDAISEFKIQTNNYSAQFGHGAGAVLNATIKSGGNEFHGDAWEFLRNDDLDASDFFQNAAGLPIPAFRRNQFGFTQGGPVWIPHVYNGKNRTFFFFDYEGTRIEQGETYLSTVPTAAERDSGFTNFADLITGQAGSRTDALGNSYPSGTIFDPTTTRAVNGSYVRDAFPGNIIPASRLDPNAIKILELLPAPNGPGILNNYTSSPTWDNNANGFDARLDKIFSEHDQFFARYSFSHLIRNQPGPFPGIADGGTSGKANLDDRNQNAIVGETHTFNPGIVNEIRLGFNRSAALFAQPYANQLGLPEQYGIQGVPQFDGNGGLPLFSVGSLSHFGSYYFLPSYKFSTVPQLTDDITFIHRSHTFKAGVFLQPDILTPTTQPPASRGDLTYSGAYTSIPNQTDSTTAVAQFLLAPIAGTYATGGADGVYYSNTLAQDMRRKSLGAYFQDDWKVTQRLTLNLGIRWDYTSFPEDREGNNVNLVPAAGFVGGTYYVPKVTVNQLPQSFINTLNEDGIQVGATNSLAIGIDQKANFAPRFGFAYQITPKLVVRGGYGIFLAPWEENGATPTQNAYPFENAVSGGAPTSVSWITPNTPGYKVGPLETTLQYFSTSPLGISPASISPISYQYHWNTPYVQNMNLVFQYQLSGASSVSVGYVGSLGRHLPQGSAPVNPALELLPPGTNATPYLAYPDVGIGGGTWESPVGASSYNSLQISYEKHFSHGLSLLTNYTWEKTRTDTLDPTDNDQSGYRAPWLAGFGITNDWHLADFNVPRMFHLSGTYELPFGVGRQFASGVRGLPSQVISGWNLNVLAIAQDGQPFTVPCAIATTAGGFGCNALTVPGQNVYAGPHNVNNFINPAAFVNPPIATQIGQTNFAPLGGSLTQASGPPFRRLDVSLFKQFRITERSRLEFRAEAFNLTNTANFSNPSNLNFLDTKSFGAITSTRDDPNDPRELQFGLKLYW
jgi:hypothetical protein